MDLLQFGKKFLFGDQSFFNQELDGCINLNAVGHEELFEGDQLVWIEFGGNRGPPMGEGRSTKILAKNMCVFKWFSK